MGKSPIITLIQTLKHLKTAKVKVWYVEDSCFRAFSILITTVNLLGATNKQGCYKK